MSGMIRAGGQEADRAGRPERRFAAAWPVLLLALAACGPENPPAEPDPAQGRAGPAARNAAVPAPTPEGGDAPPVAAASRPAEAAAAGGRGERRCGWLHNPTPANWWLFDSDGEWILGTQGGYQAPGLDEMPDMTRLGWVEVNGHYGYGCACMTLSVDPATRQVTRIDAATPRPLKQCRADPSLPRP